MIVRIDFLFSRLSLKRKTIAAILFVVGTMELLTGIILIVSDARSLHNALIQSSRINASLVAEYSVTPLMFGDVQGAQSILEKSSRIPDVRECCLVDSTGECFAHWPPQEVCSVAVAQPARVLSSSIKNGELRVQAPVNYQDQFFGFVSLVISLGPTRQVLFARAGMIGLVLIITFLVSAALAYEIQKIITLPILRVAATTEKISRDADYSTRIRSDRSDEIGALESTYDKLLDGLQLRERERDEALTKLQENISRTRAILETLPDVVLVIDSHGIVREVWGGSSRIPNLRDHHVGSSVEKIFPDDVAARFLRGSRLPGHDEVEVFEFLQDLGQERRNLEVRMIRTASEEVVAVVRDITDRRKAELQLLQMQKMETVGTLAGGLAHDFNNTLQAVRSYCEILRTHPMSPETMRLIDGMTDAVDASAALTRQLLDIARRRPVSVHRIPIARHVLNICSRFQDTAPQSITFRHDLSPDAGEITMDPVQLDQMLMNLLINARDAVAGRPEPCITLTLCMETLSGPVHALFETIPGGEYLVLTVRDNGPGIPPDRLRDIFEPFVTTKQGHGGCGLGLATVYGIVRQNGFFINVDGGYGTGATFSVYIPRKPAVPAAVVRPEGETAADNVTADGAVAMHVLLVEDDGVLRPLARRILESLGHAVTVAESAEDALRIARDSTTRIDVLMTDVVMPGMHGPDLARTIKRSRPDIAVLYVSGCDQHVPDRGGPTGSREWFLSKPYRAEELRDALRRVYAGRQT